MTANVKRQLLSWLWAACAIAVMLNWENPLAVLVAGLLLWVSGFCSGLAVSGTASVLNEGRKNDASV